MHPPPIPRYPSLLTNVVPSPPSYRETSRFVSPSFLSLPTLPHPIFPLRDVTGMESGIDPERPPRHRILPNVATHRIENIRPFRDLCRPPTVFSQPPLEFADTRGSREFNHEAPRTMANRLTFFPRGVFDSFQFLTIAREITRHRSRLETNSIGNGTRPRSRKYHALLKRSPQLDG